jgi:hypothetical protein
VGQCCLVPSLFSPCRLHIIQWHWKCIAFWHLLSCMLASCFDLQGVYVNRMWLL